MNLNRITIRKALRPAIAVATVMAILLIPQTVMACPTCKDGLHSDTAFAYAVSILFMMGMPFAIFTFWCVMIVRLRKLAAARSAEMPYSLAEQTVHSAQKIDENEKTMVLSQAR